MLWTTATLAIKTVMQGETLLQPIGITAKKAKSINFGPINFKPNNWTITKCNYCPLVFSLANFSDRQQFSVWVTWRIHSQFLRLRSHNYQAESKKGSECSGQLEEITHFLHSAWSSDAITESQSLRWFSRSSLFTRHFHLFTSFF